MERTAILRTSTPTPGFILSLFYLMLNKGLVLTADVFTEGLTKEISNIYNPSSYWALTLFGPSQTGYRDPSEWFVNLSVVSWSHSLMSWWQSGWPYRSPPHSDGIAQCIGWQLPFNLKFAPIIPLVLLQSFGGEGAPAYYSSAGQVGFQTKFCFPRAIFSCSCWLFSWITYSLEGTKYGLALLN